jgi:hypothetical protein
LAAVVAVNMAHVFVLLHPLESDANSINHLGLRKAEFVALRTNAFGYVMIERVRALSRLQNPAYNGLRST